MICCKKFLDYDDFAIYSIGCRPDDLTGKIIIRKSKAYNVFISPEPDNLEDTLIRKMIDANEAQIESCSFPDRMSYQSA